MNELRSSRYIGTGISPTNTIYVSGEGSVFAVPDTATFSYTVQDTQKDVQTAQDNIAKKANDILAYLKSQGVDEKDIQTTDYSVSPQYEWNQTACTSDYCPPGRQTLTGYQASETVTVKVRDTTKAGGLLSAVGTKGATQVSGLNFTVADEKSLEDQARGKAIMNAQAKAETLASQLGVSLVRVVSFSENSGPYYYGKGMGGATVAMDSAPAPVAPEISLGQNKITSNVTVTYEIR